MKLSLLLLCFTTVTCLKVLMYVPKFCVSHTNTMGKIADALAEAGHEVVTLMPVLDPDQRTEDTVLSRMVYVNPIPEAADFIHKWNSDAANAVWTGNNKNPLDLIHMVNLIANFYSKQCKGTIDTPGLMDSLRAEKFDFAIAEMVDLCAFTLFHKLGIEKYSAATTMMLNDNLASRLGLPQSLSYVPGTMTTFSDRMSFGERFENLLAFLAGEYFGGIINDAQEKFNRQLDPNMPSVQDLILRSSIFLVNQDPLVDYPRPLLHKIISIGGISVPSITNTTLDHKWEAILSARPRTVLVSFGTVALSHLMPEEYKQSLRAVFRHFPRVTFIWKYEREEHAVAAGIDNVVVEPWVPQQQLLGDPRLSLFLTHAGLGSTYEALARGKPIVAIPVFADQMRNARMIERSGSGVLLQKDDLSRPDVIIAAVQKILDDDSVSSMARRTAAMLASKPFSARDVLVRNVEFAATHGPFPHLNPHGQKMNFVQFYSLDVIATILFILAFVVVSAAFIVRWIVRRVFVRKTKTE